MMDFSKEIGKKNSHVDPLTPNCYINIEPIAEIKPEESNVHDNESSIAYDFPSVDRCGRSGQKKDFYLITQQALQNDSFLKIKCEEEQKEVYISGVGSRGARGDPAP